MRAYGRLDDYFKPHFTKAGVKQDAFFSGVIGGISLLLGGDLGDAAQAAGFTYALNVGLVPVIQYAYYKYVA